MPSIFISLYLFAQPIGVIYTDTIVCTKYGIEELGYSEGNPVSKKLFGVMSYEQKYALNIIGYATLCYAFYSIDKCVYNYYKEKTKGYMDYKLPIAPCFNMYVAWLTLIEYWAISTWTSKSKFNKEFELRTTFLYVVF